MPISQNEAILIRKSLQGSELIPGMPTPLFLCSLALKGQPTRAQGNALELERPSGADSFSI